MAKFMGYKSQAMKLVIALVIKAIFSLDRVLVNLVMVFGATFGEEEVDGSSGHVFL